ncbi:hypothetical protein NIES2111_03780 [Nostoc sp. NIES-2111]|nr:hypothetical protein NIES2111_03780 [Nostoc sp. NIES-2111]
MMAGGLLGAAAMGMLNPVLFGIGIYSIVDNFIDNGIEGDSEDDE